MAMIIATLDIYSGRPNPEWTLTAKEEAEFGLRLANAQIKVGGTPSVEEPLGYRGFRVRTNGASGTAELRVYKGWITGDGQTREDPGRTLERWLLETGRPTITPDLAKHLEGEIASKSGRP